MIKMGVEVISCLCISSLNIFNISAASTISSMCSLDKCLAGEEQGVAGEEQGVANVLINVLFRQMSSVDTRLFLPCNTLATTCSSPATH
jgi:hypothetical protein